MKKCAFRAKRNLLLALMVLAISNGCKNDAIPVEMPLSPPPLQLGGIECYFHVNDYRDYGEVFYNYIKHQSATDPLSLLPQDVRHDFEVLLAETEAETGHLAMEPRLAYYVAQGDISLSFKTEFLDFHNDLMALFDAHVPLNLTIQEIANWENDVSQVASLTCLEKEFLLATHVYARQILLYFSEIWGNSGETYFANDQVQLRGCGFWATMGCIFETEILVGALITGIGIALISESPVAGLIAAGVILFYDGVLNNSDNADCCEELDCDAPTGVSLSFASCTSALVTATGFGADITTLAWTNTGGTPPTATTPAAAPRVTITQTAVSPPVGMTIVATCSNGATATRIITRDIIQLARSVSGMTLSGSTHVQPSEGPEMYMFVGFALNPNYTTTWSVTNGTILSSNNQAITIQWDEEMETGEVRATVTNPCPNGQTRQFTLTVKSSEYIP